MEPWSVCLLPQSRISTRWTQRRVARHAEPGGGRTHESDSCEPCCGAKGAELCDTDTGKKMPLKQAQKLVRRHPSLLTRVPGTLAANLESLAKLLGCGKEQAQKLARRDPSLLKRDPDTLAANLAAMRGWLPAVADPGSEVAGGEPGRRVEPGGPHRNRGHARLQGLQFCSRGHGAV